MCPPVGDVHRAPSIVLPTTGPARTYAAGVDPEAALELLPLAMREPLEEFGRHLDTERNLSRHTVRAYLGDIESMLAHCAALGAESLDQVDLRALRSWLVDQQTRGRARSTMARRATAGSRPTPPPGWAHHGLAARCRPPWTTTTCAS